MNERVHSIDAARAVAMVAIVVIHTEPFGGLGAAGNAAHFVLDALARFAVPFFFLTAGYLFAVKVARTAPRAYVGTYVSRVASVYAFGLLLYAPLTLLEAAGSATIEGRAVSNAVLARTLEVLSPVDLLYYGTSVTEILWFLPALVVSIALVYGFLAVGARRYLLPVALGVHAVGLLGQSYPMILDVPLATRDALFFGFGYTAFGFWLRDVGRAPGDGADRSHYYLAGFAAFSALAVLERYVLGYVLGDATMAETVYTPEYGAMTPFASVSLFLFVLSRPRLGAGTRLPQVGRDAVGIYVLHPLVLYSLVAGVELLAMGGPALDRTILWHLLLTPVVYAGALRCYRLAARWGVVDPNGSHLPRLSRLGRAAVGGEGGTSS